MLLSALVSWLLSAVLLVVVDRLDIGLRVGSFGTAMVAALVIGVLNLLLGSALQLVALPVNLLTFGLLSIVIAWLINAVVLYVAAALVPRFRIRGFGSALAAALVLAILNWGARALFRLP